MKALCICLADGRQEDTVLGKKIFLRKSSTEGFTNITHGSHSQEALPIRRWGKANREGRTGAKALGCPRSLCDHGIGDDTALTVKDLEHKLRTQTDPGSNPGSTRYSLCDTLGTEPPSELQLSHTCGWENVGPCL